MAIYNAVSPLSAVVFTFDGLKALSWFFAPLWKIGSMCFELISVSLVAVARFLATT